MALLDLINKERAKLQRGNNNRPEKLNSEKNVIRVLPGWKAGDDTFFQYWGQHFIKDTSGAIKAVYICTQTCFGEECAVCEAIAQGAALNSDEDVLRVLKDAKSSNRVLLNVLYTKGGKHDNADTNPVVLDVPPTVFDGILAIAANYADEDVNVFDLNEGFNFIVEKTGTGMNTEYKVTPSPKSTKVDPKVMEKVKDLSAWARQESDAEKAKAVTSVRVLSGQRADAAIASAPRLSGPSRTESKLASVSTDDAIDADFVNVTGAGSDDIDDFLKDLG